MLPQAAALNGVNMNLARAVGPALGGLVVATAGAGWVFALNAVSFVGIAAMLARWRAPERARRRVARTAGRGRAGRRPIRPARADRAPAAVPGDPVHPGRQRGLGAAAGGRGPTPGPRLRRLRAAARHGRGRCRRGRVRASRDCVPRWARLAWSPGPCSSRPRPSAWSPRSATRCWWASALVPVGGAWIAVMSSLNSGLQLALPNWVRARGLAYYLVVFQGAQAVGAVVWGAVADRTSVTTALLGAAAVLALAAVVGLRAPVPDTSNLDRTPSAHWPAPQLTLSPNADDGPVLVTLTYRVSRGRTRSPSPTRCGTSAGHGDGPARCDGSSSRRHRSDEVRRVLPRRHLGRTPTAARDPADRCRPQVRGRGPPLRRRRTRGGAPVPTPPPVGEHRPSSTTSRRLPTTDARTRPWSSPGPPRSVSTPGTAGCSPRACRAARRTVCSWVVSACTWARRAARSSRSVWIFCADIVAGIGGSPGSDGVADAAVPVAAVQPAIMRSAAARS